MQTRPAHPDVLSGTFGISKQVLALCLMVNTFTSRDVCCYLFLEVLTRGSIENDLTSYCIHVYNSPNRINKEARQFEVDIMKQDASNLSNPVRKVILGEILG